MIPRGHDGETRRAEAGPMPGCSHSSCQVYHFFLVDNTQLLPPTLPGVTPQLFPIRSACFLCVLKDNCCTISDPGQIHHDFSQSFLSIPKMATYLLRIYLLIIKGLYTTSKMSSFRNAIPYSLTDLAVFIHTRMLEVDFCLP